MMVETRVTNHLTHQASRTKTFDNHANEQHSLCCGFLFELRHKEDKLHQSEQPE